MVLCEYGYGRCTAPNTECSHWMGTFCELDVATNSIVKNYCSNYVYEVECKLSPIDCTEYKRDTSDGGCYG